MKRSLKHLPPDKQNELKEIVSYVVETRSVEMIILFGSHARGDWVEDRYVENGTTYEYRSDYDLLFVVDSEDKARRYKVAKRLKRKILRELDLDTSINIIYHGIDYLNSEIEDGNYFFTDILKEGIRLYHSKKYVLSKPKHLSINDRIRKAEMYFAKWTKNGNEFLWTYEQLFNKESFTLAAFQLHQATEHFYMTALLVITDYKPKIHDLEELNTRACKLDARFKTVFPRQTEEEERMFTLLKKAYIDSRYKIGYEIKKGELEYLSNRVRLLKSMTEKVCKEKIKHWKLTN